MNLNKLKCWKVYLDGVLIDSIHYKYSYDAESIRDVLVKHDGYDPVIVVERG